MPPRGYHTNGRCGPTTKSPEELLHRSKAHTKLRARMVPACAARAFTDRGSKPQVPHSGHRGGEGGAQQAPREQPLRAHNEESRGAIAQKRGPHHASCPQGTHLRGARVLGLRQQTPGAPQRAPGEAQKAPLKQPLRAHHAESEKANALAKGSYPAPYLQLTTLCRVACSTC